MIKSIIITLSVFAALGIACAVALALPRRNALIGRRSCPPPPADPYSRSFGDWPVVPMPQGSIIDASQDNHKPLRERCR